VVSWLTGGDTLANLKYRRSHAPPMFDVEVTVDKLPNGHAKTLVIDVGLAVDAGGRIGACGIVPLQAPPGFGDIACKQGIQNWKPIRVVDTAGAPVASVQEVKVQFEVAAIPPPN
jgi:hypothetical protein